MTDHIFLPLLVVALVVLTLILSGAARRYQHQQVARRSIIRRMEAGVQAVNEHLQALSRLPINPELRTVLRRDVVNRYQTIKQVFRKYPGLQRLLNEATVSLKDEESKVSAATVPEILDEGEAARQIARLDDLSDYLLGSDMVLPPPLEQRRAFVAQLGELRAELLSRHHQVNYATKAEAGEIDRARSHLRRLMASLERRGPNTEKVRSLFKNAQEMLERSNTPNIRQEPRKAS